jgi:uncharacterized protein (TIGR00251 family)
LIAVTPHGDGSVLPVLAQAGAKRNAILGERAGALRVAVTSPPEKGKANEAIQRVLAEAFACKASQIRLVSGMASRQKRFLVGGMVPDELNERLAGILGPIEGTEKGFGGRRA